MAIHTLSLDVETFSDVDLKKCGVYKYAESSDFEILLFGVSVDGGEVTVYDLASGDTVPEEIIRALSDDSVIKWAYNASFERVCLSVWLRRNYPQYFSSYSIEDDTVRNYLDPSSWRCSLVWGAYMGLPLSLEGIGKVLKLENQKMAEGKALIRYFCVPCKPTKANGGRMRNLPEHDPVKWSTFIAYNKRDVETEMAIQQKLSKFPVPDFLWEEYHLDQEINDRGIQLDMVLVEQAIAIDNRSREELSAKMRQLTALENPNSVQQMKEWLTKHGLEVDSLDKKAVKELLKTAPPELAEVLELRRQLAKSSVKKYQAMQNAVCTDGRARGMFQFYGANRSGRWAGRLIQLQNLPQNHMAHLEDARSLVRSGDYALLPALYDSVLEVLSELIRTAFVPRDGYKFIVSDFSAIEARVLAWEAGEDWRLEAFLEGKDIYCASASQMFHVPVVKHGINGELRQKGKVAELACGYGGSSGALISMGALQMGLKEEELPEIIDSWREANPKIVQYWWDVEKAATQAFKTGKRQEIGKLAFEFYSGTLWMLLPSGRKLAYLKPRLQPNRFGRMSLTYEGVGQNHKWARQETYSGRLVENATQAIARDILAEAMARMEGYGLNIVGHVHDEVIIEAPKDQYTVEEVCKLMSVNPEWCKDLPLNAAGYKGSYYFKD